jgi:hypothetical protein
MEHIRVTTEKLIKDWQSKRDVRQERDIWDGLKKNLTKQEQKHIKHYSLRNSRVILSIDSSVWLYTINLKKEQLLKGLNQEFQSKDAITEIFLRLETRDKTIL